MDVGEQQQNMLGPQPLRVGDKRYRATFEEFQLSKIDAGLSALSRGCRGDGHVDEGRADRVRFYLEKVRWLSVESGDVEEERRRGVEVAVVQALLAWERDGCKTSEAMHKSSYSVSD
jgi:hypothetical protein